jgi:hypothetical protein
MEDKKATTIDKVHPELLAPPHIVDKLFQLIAGAWQPNPSQQEQLVVHLSECAYCRTTLIVLLSADQDYQSFNTSPEAPVQKLLSQFVTIHHEIEANDYEQMGAYAEAILSEGREKADKRFHVLAKHISKCSRCRSTLEDTLAFLSELEESEHAD